MFRPCSPDHMLYKTKQFGPLPLSYCCKKVKVITKSNLSFSDGIYLVVVIWHFRGGGQYKASYTSIHSDQAELNDNCNCKMNKRYKQQLLCLDLNPIKSICSISSAIVSTGSNPSDHGDAGNLGINSQLTRNGLHCNGPNPDRRLTKGESVFKGHQWSSIHTTQCKIYY